MIEAVVGQALRLELSLTDRVTTRFPRAIVYNELNAAIATIDLAHVADGLYAGSWTPTTTGQRSIHYTTFSDVPRTSVDATYESVVDHLVVRALDQDVSFQKILGHLGENIRDDVLTYDANNRPLTFRRRLFATKAAAMASTPGGVGEGEIFTVLGSATHFDVARWETLLRTLEP